MGTRSGHAVESLTGYRVINHGEGVAIGMVAAGQIAVEMGPWDQESCDRQLALIEKAGLPTRLPDGMDLAAIVTALQRDKKVQSGQVRFVLPTAIGTAITTDQVTTEIILNVLQKM